jgi:Arc/MetJ-type ribon-helix-helix transcriptional regulator
MGTIQVRLPEEIEEIIERQVTSGRVESASAYLIEAARRFAADLDVEDEIVAEAELGIADASAGRYVAIGTPEDSDAYHDRALGRLRDRLASDKG